MLISRVGCVFCGSGKIRIAASGGECEACYQRRRARSARRTRLRRNAAGQPTGRLIADRDRAADRMRTLHREWEAKGPAPLPAAITLLERLRAALDSVAVLDTELGRRYLAGTRPGPDGAVPREEVAFRRRLLMALESGTRTVHNVLDQASEVHESESATIVADTHAFAIVAAAVGHRRTLPSADTGSLSARPGTASATRSPRSWPTSPRPVPRTLMSMRGRGGACAAARPGLGNQFGRGSAVVPRGCRSALLAATRG
ncbi:hypothetical protein [Streptomyces sp. NPDC000410]|uniref:hypothetical protein n=1 Tax=Streptomyces sp. NPDC000410 TaxID=3154254 RepID=UPI00332279CC